ncbi:nicotinate phosphoribosyltransferase [Streptosporangium sp. 'caverna']|uniref:nicotinate phosphoribosyltransferase n=1 Tax=Streptosporangium sp. 'caverna' TaxID=2202249 RepID=UPI000D7DF18B|nr:nicotinate phosphoribosyltransferase [Streptosporangium sp. 'caverna']AWS41145.1 nicotinate phosphoribosyltransferase [Streptosporangium sp. 'caverna']
MTMAMSSALLTDHYELTMLEASLRSGAASRRAVFEVFARQLPGGRRYGVVAGTGRVLETLEHFRFEDEDLTFLRDNHVVDARTLEFLADYRFSGHLYGYAEGECYFPGSPIMTVEGTFAEAVLLETVILSVLNHDCAIATAASRMIHAAGSRPLIEMGSRRTHEMSAVAAARAAYLAGFSATSNLMAGHAYGVPTAGTAAHAFTLLHDSEEQAFQAQINSLGTGTTLLVDTYDVAQAVRTAVDLAGPSLGAVRLDSGDLAQVAHEVREQLDALGAHKTRIIVTSDLDEYAIAALASAPVDVYGVGTSLVTGSGSPTAALVYKLVAREDADGIMRPVAKKSVGKPSRGGRKDAFRKLDATGTAIAELVTVAGDPPADARPLQVQLVKDGEVVGRETLEKIRGRHRDAVAELPAPAHQLSRGYAAIPTMFD